MPAGHCKIRAFMNFWNSLLCVLGAGLLMAGGALAERADRNKPMNVESDTLRYDDNKQTSVFTGNVVVTKGTMIIRGARLDVRQDAQGYQYGVVTAEPGKRAFFRQKRDTPPGAQDEFMEGEAKVIEYDGKADVVHFRDQAQLRRYLGAQLNDTMDGSLIVYDNTTSILTVDGGSPRPGAQGAGSGRVRAVLTPRNDGTTPATAPAPAPAASQPLRRSGTLGGAPQ